MAPDAKALAGRGPDILPAANRPAPLYVVLPFLFGLRHYTRFFHLSVALVTSSTLVIKLLLLLLMLLLLLPQR